MVSIWWALSGGWLGCVDGDGEVDIEMLVVGEGAGDGGTGCEGDAAGMVAVVADGRIWLPSFKEISPKGSAMPSTDNRQKERNFIHATSFLLIGPPCKKFLNQDTTNSQRHLPNCSNPDSMDKNLIKRGGGD